MASNYISIHAHHCRSGVHKAGSIEGIGRRENKIEQYDERSADGLGRCIERQRKSWFYCSNYSTKNTGYAHSAVRQTSCPGNEYQSSHRLTSAVSIPNQDISPQYMAVVQELEDLQFTLCSDAVAVVKTVRLRNRPQDDGEGRTPVDSSWCRNCENRRSLTSHRSSYYYHHRHTFTMYSGSVPLRNYCGFIGNNALNLLV